MSEPEALKRIEALRGAAGKGRGLPVVLEARADRQFVGVVTIDLKSDAPNLGKLGYWIAEPFQGRGFAQEAVSAATEVAIRLLPITSVEAAVEVENAASIAVLKRCGFEEVDCRRVYAPSKGALFLCAIYRKNEIQLSRSWRCCRPRVQDGPSRPIDLLAATGADLAEAIAKLKDRRRRRHVVKLAENSPHQ